MTIDQIAIFICSAGSIWFLSGKRPIIGFGLGLIGQPFWLWTAWQNSQWAIFALAFWFAFCHARGFRRQWIKNGQDMADLKKMEEANKTLETVLSAARQELDKAEKRAKPLFTCGVCGQPSHNLCCPDCVLKVGTRHQSENAAVASKPAQEAILEQDEKASLIQQRKDKLAGL